MPLLITPLLIIDIITIIDAASADIDASLSDFPRPDAARLPHAAAASSWRRASAAR